MTLCYNPLLCSHSQATGGDQVAHACCPASLPSLALTSALLAPQANAIYLELERMGFKVRLL